VTTGRRDSQRGPEAPRGGSWRASTYPDAPLAEPPFAERSRTRVGDGGVADLVHLDETPGHECGVFAVFAPGQPVAHLTYLGLYALQHRGQESSGMAVADGETVTVVKDMGLVSNAFDDRTLAALTGHLAIGHTRYSTTGSSQWCNAQPFYRNAGEKSFALAHNGNLVNTGELADSLGMLPGAATSDSDLVAELLMREMTSEAAGEAPSGDAGDTDDADGPLARAVASVVPRLKGAFSFVLTDEERIMGVRDPHGFWPLVLGRLDNGWVLASETPALDVVGAAFIREIEPGEMIVIDASGPRTIRPFPAVEVDPKLCLFEFVYFHRPDGRLYNQSVHQARVRMGEQLAEQAPVDADLVMGVPESGLPAAEGFARHSGIPYGQGLVKNRYIGRTFIAPNQQLRALGVRMKLNPLSESIRGKRLVVVDDSIVRGTTTRAMVSMLRESGAAEVHLRISSPPYRWPCFYGMDTGRQGELLAANLGLDEIARFLDVDSLSYLTLDRLVDAVGAVGAGFCDACLTGRYPVEVPVDLSKQVLEPDGPPVGGAEVTTLGLLFGSDVGIPADAARGDGS
jgi:amidophosphoribosyltransferase